MRPRPSLVVAVVSGLAGVVLGVMLGRPSTAQPAAPVAGPREVGRYQVSVTGDSSSPYVVVIDTATGKCWQRSPRIQRAPWHEIVPPPAAGR